MPKPPRREVPKEALELARVSPAGLAVLHTQPFPPEKRWRLYPYMRLIAERVTLAITKPGGGRLMLFMPPRHGKSLFCSVYVPAWFILTQPTRKVLLVSYGEALAAEFSRQVRNVVEALGVHFGVRVSKAKSSLAEWAVEYADESGEWREGGNVYAQGVDGSVTGRGAHLIVMDDVVRGHTDTTPAMMEKAYASYRSTLETRQEPGCSMLLVMTRWAQADLAGRLLADEGERWETLTLPALAKDGDPLERKPGEALCPERFGREWLEQKRDSSEEGGLLFAALYQQEPLPSDGTLWKPGMFRYYTVQNGHVFFGPEHEPLGWRGYFATVDPSLKAGERNDPTGLLVWAVSRGGHLVLLEDGTRRMNGSVDLLPALHALARKYRGIVFHVEEVAHGTEIVRAAQREGLQVVGIKPGKGDKVTRWYGAIPAFSAGRVWFPGIPRCVELEAELLAVPGARHDDRADAVALAVSVWRDRTAGLRAVEFAHGVADALRRVPGRSSLGGSAPWAASGMRDGPAPQVPGGHADAHPEDRPRPSAPRWRP